MSGSAFFKAALAFAAAGLSASAFFTPAPARADEVIKVVMDQARIVKLPRAADTIIIGNPEIADAAVQDARTVVLTGKGFGVTNMVALDTDGKPIVDEQIVVSRQTAESLRVYRRTNVQTLSCTPYCEVAYKTEAAQTSDAEMGMGY
jgi:Flp pilus assembly secretin CpaC